MPSHHMITGAFVALLLVHPFLAKSNTRGFSHAFVTHNGQSRRSCPSTFSNSIANKETAIIYHDPSYGKIRKQLPLSHPNRQRSSQTALASTTAKGGSGATSTQHDSYNVLYQKVLRAPKSSSQTFLLDLVSYLQCVFQLPNDLPMPYEMTVPEDDDGGYEPSDNRAILIIDSPLSSDPCDACLEVEVIGIFPDDTDMQAGPAMAMVALKKRKSPNSADGAGGGGVAQGLFAASEKRIVHSLDRGLQDLEEGRVSVPQSSVSTDSESAVLNDFEHEDDGVDAALKRIGYKNSIDAAKTSVKEQGNEQTMKTPNEPISIERDGLGNVIIDSVAKPETKKAEKAKKSQKIEKPTDRTISPPPQKPMTESPPKETPQDHGEDYAIKMAREQAKALMTTVTAGSATSSAEGTVAISGGEGDFAIMAAKRAAAASRSKRKAPMKGASKPGDASMIPTPKVQKGKVQDLSNDEMFLKLQKIANGAKKSAWSSTISKKGDLNRAKKPSVTVAKSKSKSPKKTLKDQQAIMPNEKSEDEIRDDIMKIAQENKEVQEQLRAATEMMPIEKEGEEGLSPEELLEQVLKFGEEKEKEEKPGRGFVDGVFEKARELGVMSREDGSKAVNELKYKEVESEDELRRKAEEEELRRIFATGQSVAENKLSQPVVSQPSNLANPSITEDDIDALIDADETVPRNARVLDEELAELEVRMGRSQEEESDGPPQNKLFDVFSGPEVYNRNVDPETAVNWPGAKEGTRTDVQLATDLSTALKQARFAAAVLSQMKEKVSEEDKDKVQYFVGTKELSLERVNLLRNCVNEAVKAGIIEDPEIIMVERARLQMIIDELVSQPEERLEEIAMNYKDLLLSNNLVDLIKERLHAMAQQDIEARREGKEDLLKEMHARERAIMINLAQISQGLVKDAQALGAELEVSMLEIIRSICEVAMDPSHKTEEDTAVALTDAVRDMRPLLDDAFVAYLKYAIAEEEGKLARGGVVDDPEHNRWLFVLKIVQEGVYAELSQGVKRYVDHIWYVLRMKSKSERKELLRKLIDAMPTMDVRPFVKVVNNIVSSLGTTLKGDFTDGVILGEMTNQLLQLQRDVSELLPPERIDELSKDADAWAAAQRQRLLERRNLSRQRLEAARQTGDIDPDEVIKRPGAEAERFD
eukprot:CAMPEP_0183711682 /NCGR_PEP_ID=MMETSP0737-20130205/7131_1 /TAXON_ID=385413 /ORGANISM="Thalassiosira miniscula, Strain CCMP1093" /LENGTH=1153 /DNA_ID=CAMNT_0025940249 /DNA_START=252 /DNA_END=3713 /DNA_ORIENTATION=-